MRFPSAEVTDFFFHPVQFHLQLTDLLIQLSLELLTLLLALVVIARKDGGYPIQYLFLSLVYLAGMYPVLTSYFRNSALIPDSFKSYLSFESTVMLFPDGHLYVPPTCFHKQNF